jgi:hypothetical protein
MTIPTPDEICDFLHELDGWERAYPLSAFPEPDMRKAAELLKADGMTLDAISASNMRHVVSQIAPKAADLIQQQQATIERLSAALEHLIDIIDGTEATGFDPHVEQMLMDAAETGRAALGKDASDVRSPGSSEGE